MDKVEKIGVFYRRNSDEVQSTDGKIGWFMDKVTGLITLLVTIIDLLYIKFFSVSIVLNIIVLMWVLILIPTILTYFRGNGEKTWNI